MSKTMAIRVTHIPTGKMFLSKIDEYDKQGWDSTMDLLEKINDLTYLQFRTCTDNSTIVIPRAILDQSVLEMVENPVIPK